MPCAPGSASVRPESPLLWRPPPTKKDGRLFLQIANSCSFPVQFRAEGIPTTSQPGHGLGVRSICAIVEQYGGMYSFSQQQDQFGLRISL